MKAQAQVVRPVPTQGLGMAFISMEGEAFQLLDSWLSIFVATTWVAAHRRRSQRISMQIKVRVSGYNPEGARFTENTHTVQISAFGGSVILKTPVNRGQRLVVFNLQTKVTVECMVAYHETKSTECIVGLAFTVLNQSFWPVEFPSADWSYPKQDTERSES